MGNECSAECGVRKAETKEASAPPRLRNKDPPARLHTRAMVVHRQAGDWRAKYNPSQEELGEGATATVLHAEAKKAKPPEASVLLLRCHTVSCQAPLGFSSSSGRPVAVKRFRKPGTRSFQLELHALMRVGVHPNIVRLLESYSGSEDVLVLEYCDSLTLYDLIVKRYKTKTQFGRSLTSQLMQQLLLALEHVAKCGICHQDVKPENLMLHDLSIEDERVHMKLGDFGWAVTRDDDLSLRSPEGAGSLWYAPPELNPPVEGVFNKPGAVIGKSDMWSAGVVIYVILVGHNPFHSASKLKDTQKVEEEVLRLVAKGTFDKKAPAWLALPRDAQEFISQLLQPSPELRPEPAIARRHRYVCEHTHQEQQARDFANGPKLGGVQGLAWLAMARACAESDLQRDLVKLAFASAWNSPEISATSASETYLLRLAEKLSTKPMAWMKEGRFPAICELAFRYLDVDGDSVLSVKDLVKHISEDNARHVATNWVTMWGNAKGMSLENFRDVLLCDMQLEGDLQDVASPAAANILNGHH